MDYIHGLRDAFEIMENLFNEALAECDKAKDEYDKYKHCDKWKAIEADTVRVQAIGKMEIISEAKQRLYKKMYPSEVAV